jgi:hypothetical protein
MLRIGIKIHPTQPEIRDVLPARLYWDANSIGVDLCPSVVKTNFSNSPVGFTEVEPCESSLVEFDCLAGL